MFSLAKLLFFTFHLCRPTGISFPTFSCSAVLCRIFLSHISVAPFRSDLCKCCFMSSYFRDAQSREQDGRVILTDEETAILSGQQGKSRPWSADSVDADDTEEATTSGQFRPSLFRCLARVYGLSLLKAHLCKFICDLLLFVGPMLQK